MALRAEGRSRVAVGVDVAEVRKGLDLVALDQDRRLVFSQGHLSVAEVTAIILDEIRPGVVCIDSPSGWSRSGRRREGERALSRMGISSFATGSDPGDHSFYRWMRVGISLFEALAVRYPLFRGDDPKGKAAEVFPNATSVLLAGRRRARDETKGTFRRGVLDEAAVDERALPNIDRVDAALAALTGVMALEGRWSGVGDPEEGSILLPVCGIGATGTAPSDEKPG